MFFNHETVKKKHFSNPGFHFLENYQGVYSNFNWVINKNKHELRVLFNIEM